MRSSGNSGLTFPRGKWLELNSDMQLDGHELLIYQSSLLPNLLFPCRDPFTHLHRLPGLVGLWVGDACCHLPILLMGKLRKREEILFFQVSKLSSSASPWLAIITQYSLSSWMSQALSKTSQRFRYRPLDPVTTLIHIAAPKAWACQAKALNFFNIEVTSFIVCHDNLIFLILPQD